MIQAKRVGVKEAGARKSWLKCLFVGLGAYLVWVLAGGLMEIRQAFGRLEEARKELGMEEARREELEKKLLEIKTRGYVERVARNDLNMQLPGETIVVLPKSNYREERGEKMVERELPNWEKWWRLVR